MKSERNVFLSFDSKEKTLFKIYCYTKPPGIVCFISSVLQSQTQSYQQGFCVCLSVCVWLAQTWQLFVSVFMCVYVCYGAVKVYEPDGGCGQKQRIAKVHVAVTLCFLHDKDCQSLHPFALSLLYRPFLSHSSSFRLLFPPHPFSFPIQCLFSPTIAAGLFLC